jgi:hypothetical protein
VVPARQRLRVVLVVLVDGVDALVESSPAVIEVASLYDVLKTHPQAYRSLVVALDLVDREDN